jgi:sodium transport system permease protein
MNASQVRQVYRKEMTETLRDRRTLMSMIVVPILVIPGLMFGLAEVTIRMVKKAAGERAAVMILGEEHAPALAARMRAHPLLEVVPAASDYAKRIEDKELRAAVEFPPGFEAALATGAPAPTVRIDYYEEEIRSELALRKIEELLQKYKDEIVAARLRERDLATELLQPFASESRNVASAERVGGAAAGGILPYIIILLTLTGAMYPAIDLTAGEKERGTIETILASPVQRQALAAGKFLTVLTTALATAVLSVLSLALSGRFAARSGSGLGAELPFALTLEPGNIAAMLLIMIPVAVLFAGALLAIALMAKSYKEAQSYVSPLMIVVILPAVAAMLPGVELDMRLALVPILNVSLASKELVTGIYDWPLIGVIFASSCVYASIALAVAVSFFRRESVLFRT